MSKGVYVRTFPSHLKGKKLPDEHRNKLSKAHMGQPGYWLGKKIPVEAKKKMSSSHVGKKTWQKGLTKETSSGLKEMSEKYCKGLIDGTRKLPSRWFNTLIEQKVELELLKQNFTFRKQVHIKDVGVVDFFLPEHNIIVECDGDYWHNLPGSKEKDDKRNFLAKQLGYRTYRFWEHEINTDVVTCVKRIQI